MKYRNKISILVLCIALLSLFAAGVGIWSSGGSGAHPFVSVHGQVVSVFGKGIYANDSVASAAQTVAQDWVTVFLGIPLLLLSLWFARKGALRARLLLTGTLAYFLYTYMSYTFLCMYNSLFLIYTALMSLSFFAFVLAILSFDIPSFAGLYHEKLPVKTIGASMIVFASLIGLMWLGRIVPPLLNNTVPVGLEHYTTLVIQAMDLGFVIPVSFLAGILFLKRRPLGLLLAAIMCMKGLTMLTALTAMVASQALAGVPMTVPELVIFPAANVLVVFGVVVFLKRIREPEQGKWGSQEKEQKIG